MEIGRSVKPGAPAEARAVLSPAQRGLVVVYLAVSVWYLSWRPGSLNPDAMAFSVAVYAAELFGFLCAALTIFMCWRLQRRSRLPVPTGSSVAVFVPTINESVDMVRRTLMAAQRMEHAAEVWLLDDGNRPAMRALAGEIGCRYLARTVNTDAKAGNLNNALPHTDARFIAIFDADHAPAPTFLAETLGFFADDRVAFVQTPQDFYNIDSFQHRRTRGSVIWSEQTLFFKVIQAGKDRWNSAFFCGSCAVIRRAALDDIGGFATGTVTEDIHTSIKLHKRGWQSAYYARSLAFGLAPASAMPFLKQRLRWGQGAMQVWRKEGVLFTRGLTLPQRLCYLATMLAYFEGWQRALFFVAPVVVLTTGALPIIAFDGGFLVRFVPYYLLTFWAFEEVARGYGRSLLTEQYNMVRFAVFMTATFGVFLRRLRFVVTPKDTSAAEATRRNLWPQFTVLILNAVAIPVGITLYGRGSALPLGALIANVIWAAATFSIAALAIHSALRLALFKRREYRFPLPVPLRITTRGGTAMGLATDISPLGFRVIGTPVSGARAGDELEGELWLPTGRVPVRAVVRGITHRQEKSAGQAASMGCEIRRIAPADRAQLEMFLYGSDLQWRLNGLEERVSTPLERFGQALRGERPRARLAPGQRWSPLLYRRSRAGQPAGVGFISSADAASSTRTIVSLDALAHHQALDAEEVTPDGAHTVAGSIADEQVLESDAAPIYLYRLTA